MSYVITEACVSTCDTACVDVCPVDAIAGPVAIPTLRSTPEAELRAHHPKLQLYIDPESCICCAACVAECPVNAIYDEDDVPSASRASIAENAAFFEEKP